VASKSKPDAPAKPEPAPQLPLFYKQPQALVAGVHGGLRLTGQADFRFAAGTNAAPITATEFVEAMRFYPIVFVGEATHPSAVLGLDSRNLFVDADGGWAEGRYVPAYARRYPFVFIESADKSQYALGVDMASDRLTTDADAASAQPLFVDGQPAPVTQDALRFCAALQADHATTRLFCQALADQELLVDQQAQGALPSGERFNVQGFRIIDAAKLQALPDEVVLDWRRKGWLTLIDLHLASLNRWRDLLDRQGERKAAA
jgi:hypothetical protein